MAKQIMFTGIRKVELQDYEFDKNLDNNEVYLQTLYSGISAGTERTIYQGTAPFYNKKFDEKLHLFVKAETTTWTYPLAYGYENVAKIVAVGKDVSDFKVGDVVGTYYPHFSEYKCNVADVFKLPEGLDTKEGVFVALAGVAYNGILDAEIQLGETVVIFGAGIVGQLLIQLAKKSGAKQVVSIDYSDKRLELAKTSGADVTINPKNSDDVALQIRNLTENRGADVVIEASGSSFALQEAIRTVCFMGRVVVVSFLAGENKGLYLGDEFHHNRIKLISSQACGVNPSLHPRWDSKRKFNAALNILPSLKLNHLISHVFKPQEAATAYETADSKQDAAMQVIFDWQ